VLHVHLASLALEVVTGAEDTSSEPDSVGLDQVLVTFGFHGVVVTGHLVIDGHSVVEDVLHLALESLIEAGKERAAAREDDVLVKLDSEVNRAFLDRVVDYLTKWLVEILVVELWVEEHLWAEESLVSNIDADVVAIYGREGQVLKLRGLLDSSVLVFTFLVVLGELLEYVLAYVAVLLFGLGGDLSTIFWLEDFSSCLELVSDVFCNVSSSEWDMLDGALDDLSAADREHMGDTITCIDNSASETV